MRAWKTRVLPEMSTTKGAARVARSAHCSQRCESGFAPDTTWYSPGASRMPGMAGSELAAMKKDVKSLPTSRLALRGVYSSRPPSPAASLACQESMHAPHSEPTLLKPCW